MALVAYKKNPMQTTDNRQAHLLVPPILIVASIVFIPASIFVFIPASIFVLIALVLVVVAVVSVLFVLEVVVVVSALFALEVVVVVSALFVLEVVVVAVVVVNVLTLKVVVVFAPSRLRVGPLVGTTVAYPPRLLMSLLFETFRPVVGLLGVGLFVLVVPAPGLLLALKVFMA